MTSRLKWRPSLVGSKRSAEGYITWIIEPNPSSANALRLAGAPAGFALTELPHGARIAQWIMLFIIRPLGRRRNVRHNANDSGSIETLGRCVPAVLDVPPQLGRVDRGRDRNSTARRGRQFERRNRHRARR